MPRHTKTDSLGFLITDISRLMRASFDRRIAEAGIGLTDGEGRALVHAARAGAVRQNVLAERMGVEAMTLSGYIDRLEARGLVTRIPDPDDRRAKLVDLTDAADAVLSQIATVSATGLRQASHGIDPEDWARFIETLKRIRANLADNRREATPESSAA